MYGLQVNLILDCEESFLVKVPWLISMFHVNFIHVSEALKMINFTYIYEVQVILVIVLIKLINDCEMLVLVEPLQFEYKVYRSVILTKFSGSVEIL